MSYATNIGLRADFLRDGVERAVDCGVPLGRIILDPRYGLSKNTCHSLELMRRLVASAKSWAFIKEQRFFGMIIPKEYGGLGFSAIGHARVITRIASRSVTAAVTVMVPNSLGPGELLVDHGTAEQKRRYLARLARGEEIPCFALTGPEAGSDAAATQSEGIVEKRMVDGEEILGMRLNWRKRYITLAPVATLIGLAFRLRDPHKLLGDTVDLGICCALIPRATPGIAFRGHRGAACADRRNDLPDDRDAYPDLRRARCRRKAGRARLDREGLSHRRNAPGGHRCDGHSRRCGDSTHVANALYARAVADRSIRLEIFTALTLERPQIGNELERRFIDPAMERLFGAYPELAYANALRERRLPPNIAMVVWPRNGETEQLLIPVLRTLKEASGSSWRLFQLAFQGLLARDISESDEACLARLGVARPTGISEHFYNALLRAALRQR